MKAHVKYRFEGKHVKRNVGFTLVEVLVTLTIFALAVTTLIAGLRSGIAAWQGVRRHQEADALLLRAERTLREDFRAMARTVKEQPALTEAVADTGGETITFTAIPSLAVQRAQQGSVWTTITYGVERSEDYDTLGLVRSEVPYVGSTPMETELRKGAILANVESVRFSYYAQGEPSAEWDNGDALPQAVEVKIERKNAPALTWIFWVPVGALETDGAAQ